MIRPLGLCDVILGGMVATISAMLGVSTIFLLYRWLDSDKYRPPQKRLGWKIAGSIFFIVVGFAGTVLWAWFILWELVLLGQDVLWERHRIGIIALIVPAGFVWLGFYALAVGIIEWRTGKEFPGAIHAVEPKPPQEK